MNSKIYRQADSRWGSLPYPTKRYSFAGNGCGCCAVLHCVIEQDKYKNYTPKDIRPYMVQYATKGNGTLWSGITKGLEHYGYNVHWRQSDSMSDIFKVLKNSLKRGVILFGSNRGPDGTTQVPSLGGEDSLEEGTAAHSSILPGEFPWTEEPGGLRSIGSQRIGHD